MNAGHCCGGDRPAPPENPLRVVGHVETPAGNIPRVDSTLAFRDRIGAWKVRWNINRMDYAVPPGLYALGDPTEKSPVLVSANYKLSFDVLRSDAAGLDAWILVLDTGGVNVWCAAGKGTFGTAELVRRVEEARLSKIVSHRKLIVPQLGATGVSGFRVKEQSGFYVVYGPVRSRDLRAFLDAGMKATPEMRRVRFGLRDRTVLIPVELVAGAGKAFLIAACLFLLAGLRAWGYSFDRALETGLPAAGLLAGAFLFGVIFFPPLLPWLPGRAFSLKGAFLGAAGSAGVAAWACHDPGFFGGWLGATGWILAVPALVSFLALNFTGASTYTSLSGVRLETRIALPLQIAFAAVGAALWIAGRFLQ